jgi:hypothetical protein
MIGRITGEVLGCTGAIDDLRIQRGAGQYEGVVPTVPAVVDANTIALFSFDEMDQEKEVIPNLMSADSKMVIKVQDALSLPEGDRFLDEVQEEQYMNSTLHGDAAIEMESLLPLRFVKAEKGNINPGTASGEVLSLDGEWLLKEGAPRVPWNIELKRLSAEESEGVKAGWFKEGVDRIGWRKVTVPTSVQSALLKLGELENPFWDTNTWDELKKNGWPQDFTWNHRKTRIEQKEWWFARSFDVPQTWQGKSIRLYFDGIDYAGSVYLNGKPLGYHAGMFGGPELDVSKLVYFDKPNEVVVRVDGVPDSWFGILKGSPGWGWHYGHLISTGIWRSVEIATVPEVELQAPFVKTMSISESEAVLRVEYYVVNGSPDPVDVQVSGQITGKTFKSDPITFQNNLVAVPYGKSRFETEITVKNPKLWWPVNYGAPDRYTLVIQTGDAKGKIENSQSTDFGIRTVSMNPMRGQTAETDYRWQFVINGLPMFIKGCNWCWTDPMLEVDPAKYEQILELAKRAGIQMFRSWGGGIVETDPFYEKCDEKGLMVYQEFPYCWGPPDFPMTDPSVLDDQVSRVVKRNRNHPSLVMWGGGNENVRIAGADEGLFLVGRRCRQFDPTRPFHRTSPWGGSFHNWGVFHNGLPFDSGFINNPSVWYGEFGQPSVGTYEETLKYMPKEKLEKWPPAQDDGGWQMHMNQFGFGDMAKVMRYCDYGPIQSWKNYIEYSQMSQGDEIAFACNQQRAGSYLNKGGLWFYKLTELFPGQSWGVLGFYSYPKLSYYRVKKLFAPQAAFAFYEKYDWQADEKFKASLHVNNDTSKPLEKVTVQAALYGSDLKTFWEKSYPVASVSVASRVDLDALEIDLPAGKIAPFLMSVRMTASDGKLLSDQWYWFNFKAKTEKVNELEKIAAWGWPHDRAPEAFEAYANLPEARLLNLPRTNLTAVVKQEGLKGTLTLSNTGTLPAFNVLIDGFPYEYGCFLDDNSLCLLPGESRSIAFELGSEKDTVAGLSARAWNADAVTPTK